ncbi:hypothetical protein [Lysobacter gummosus]|uniref:hypothetical protein n=1 Tax=Lysobacter gummosus TaxID=262324 RepID=UPI003638237A
MSGFEVGVRASRQVSPVSARLRWRSWSMATSLPGRYCREGRLRFTSAEPNIQRLQRHPSRPSFPRKRESSDFKGSRTKGPGCSAPPK